VLLGVGVLVLVLARSWGSGAEEQLPEAWRRLVQTEGQFYPIPEAWLGTPEGKIAHSLKLPDSLPKPVPFDFDEADGPWYWPKKDREVAVAYFRHLCETEAGEWVLRTAENVEGIYFARPGNQPSDVYLGDLYGPEAPWLERNFQLMAESPDGRGGQFVRPPYRNFKFVEEPKRDVKWQRDIKEDYIRIHGYTFEKTLDPTYHGKRGLQRLWFDLREKTPMRADGIPAPTAKYALTWRGIARPQDRHFGIAGGEIIIYERESKEILAVGRIFQITGRNRRRNFSASWMVSPTCGGKVGNLDGLPLQDFYTRALHDTPIDDPDLSWTRRNEHYKH